jgi:DNA-binding CsgD family transcriptional regulator
MGAVEHLKTLCCLGLPPESAMIAVVPLLHEIIPHGWPRIWLFEPDATVGSCYGENPEAGAIFRERFWRFSNDPSGLASLVVPTFRSMGIGWSLPRQGQGWLESAYYQEVEAPLDSCWILDAMIGESGRTIAGLHLTRPRTARPFRLEDVRTLDRLRPWLAHALRGSRPRHMDVGDHERSGSTGQPVRSGQMILTFDETIVFQTPGLELLLRTLAGERANYLQRLPARDHLPSAIRTLVRRLVCAANASLGFPPRMRIPCAYGLLVLEATWLVPANTPPEEVARDPKSCFITVTIELRENAIAHAARILRESGATPGQVKVGVRLALGKSKTLIARELGMQPSSVADQTKKLYQRLDVHNAAELGLELWLHRMAQGACK